MTRVDGRVATLTRIDFAGIAIEIDKGRTAELYNRFPTDWCQCDGCSSARIARMDAMPTEQAELLSKAGLDPLYPYISSWAPHHYDKNNRRYGRRNDCWLAHGKVIGAERTPILSFAPHHRMWISSDMSEKDKVIEAWGSDEPHEEDLIYIFASNVIPLMHNEVCEFRSERVLRCSNCGSDWRLTGYLKRRSLIPEWKNLPELSKVLREGRKRVLVSFCHRCGQMEYSLVDRKRPFRQKDKSDREYKRLLRQAKVRLAKSPPSTP